MSLERVHLRTLLRIFGSSGRGQTKLLSLNLSSDQKKVSGSPSSGGDFHGPFWADAKAHIREKDALSELTKVRIEANRHRARLYPLLERGFLGWWSEKRRWINEKYELLDQPLSGSVSFPLLNGIVKVENLVAVRLANGSHRVVYPYFSEEPILSTRTAKLGLWVISQALPQFDSSELRILDTLRSRSYATVDVPFGGDEEKEFSHEYEAALNEWAALKAKSAKSAKSA